MMFSRFLQISLIVAAVAGLSACAGPNNIGSRNPQVATVPDKVSLMLAEAADRSSTALQTLAAIEQARTPEVSVAPVADAPAELKRAITTNWVGPVEPVVKMLADRASYGFQIVGNAPPVPIIVSINVENKPVIEVLRNIGLQLGVRADVTVDSERRMVEVHYGPNTGPSGE